MGSAKLARLLFLVVLAAALGLQEGVSEAADGDLTITVDIRDNAVVYVDWDNPNSRSGTWWGFVYTGECGVGTQKASFWLAYSTTYKSLNAASWADAGARYCVRIYNGTAPAEDQTDVYFTFPEAGPGVLTITVAYPETGQIKFTWDNPNSRTTSWQGKIYAGTCGVAPVSATIWSAVDTPSKALASNTWAVAGARYCVRISSGTMLDRTDAEFTYPGALQSSYDLGPPAFTGFTTAHNEYGVATVFVSVPDAPVDTTVSLTWTFSLTPLDVPEPLYVTLDTSDHDGVVGVSHEAPGLLVYGAYTATVKAQGAEDDTAQSMTFAPVPEHIPFHAPGILKVTDQTPDSDTASLLVAWSGAPVTPPTGFWIRYNLGTPLLPDSGREANILRGLPPIARNVGTVDIEVLAYYAALAEVTYRGEDQTVPYGEIWFTPWSETYSINIARASRTGSEVPPKPVAPLVVDTAEKLLEASGLPADQAHSYSLLFLLFLTLGVGGFLYAATGGGPMSATLAGFVGVIIWSGLGWWWFGLPVAMALVPLMLIIIVGGMAVTTRVLS